MNFPTIQQDKIILSKESQRSQNNKLARKGSAYSDARSTQFQCDVFERKGNVTMKAFSALQLQPSIVSSLSLSTQLPSLVGCAELRW